MKRFGLQTDDGNFLTQGPAVDLSIPLRFTGPQPGFFGAAAATAQPMHTGDFIGDTRLGGSCNAEQLDLIPHCNGTHTECIGHITHERIAVNLLATEALYLAAVVTAATVAASDTGEDPGSRWDQNDRLITASTLQRSLLSSHSQAAEVLIVRTLPNEQAKRYRNWTDYQPLYFSVDAMHWIVAHGFRHLLVDTPSVDRPDDDGNLVAHRIFWGLPGGSYSVDDATRTEATITELIYVPDEVEDGLHLLDLQIAAFVSDAAPSRPLLYRIAE